MCPKLLVTAMIDLQKEERFRDAKELLLRAKASSPKNVVKRERGLKLKFKISVAVSRVILGHCLLAMSLWLTYK